jgi:hypothetical protein
VVREPSPGECVADCTVAQYHACGRRPSGLREARRPPLARHARGVAGTYLAGAARLEAASVTAFERLAGELEAHGAPARLVASARKSARDERRHTRAVSALAARFGGEVIMPRVRPIRARSLRAMAAENAVEGCVREAYGALVATYQAEHAEDAHVRRAMRVIAADETAHAALAYRVAHWVERRLDRAPSRSVRAAMRRAGASLLREASAPVHPDLVTKLGVPRQGVAKSMAEGLLAILQRALPIQSFMPPRA